MILTDISVLIDLFRGNDNQPVTTFKEILQNNVPFSITSLLYQEILQGARNQKEYALLNRYLSSQRFLHPKDDIITYRKAALIYYRARRNGITIRSATNCLIAQIAIEHQAYLLHNDNDFKRIAEFTQLKLFRV
ncbi:MAG TPA: PIN domain nuclease [Calditrichaeota bacterium]|nr:PIN domain nuclease [Calditrichota bacterium]